MNPAPTCRTHLARAGWICTQCKQKLCRRCAWWRAAGRDTVVICRSCQALAQPIMVGRTLDSFSDLLRHLFDYPWVGEGKYVLAGGAIILGLLALCSAPGVIFSDILLISYLFHVVRESWTGRTEPPGFPEAGDIFDYWLTAFRGAIAFGLALLPLTLYTAFAGWHAFDPLLTLFLVIGLLWAPIGIVRAAVRASLGEVVNPFAAWRAVARMRREYVIAVVLFWGLAGGWWSLGWLGDWIVDTTGIFLLPRALMVLPQLYVAMMAARVLGILLLTHGAELGYGRDSDYLVPILGELLPQDEAPALTEETAAEAAPEPIELPTLTSGPVVDLFVPYQPGADKGEIALDEPAMPAPVVRPEAVRPPVLNEDLVSQEQFMADLSHATHER